MGFGSTSFDGQHGGSKRRHRRRRLEALGVGIILEKNTTFIVPVAE